MDQGKLQKMLGALFLILSIMFIAVLAWAGESNTAAKMAAHEQDDRIIQISGAAIMILLAIVAYFLKRSVHKQDQAMDIVTETLEKLAADVAHIKDTTIPELKAQLTADITAVDREVLEIGTEHRMRMQGLLVTPGNNGWNGIERRKKDRATHPHARSVDEEKSNE